MPREPSPNTPLDTDRTTPRARRNRGRRNATIRIPRPQLPASSPPHSAQTAHRGRPRRQNIRNIRSLGHRTSYETINRTAPRGATSIAALEESLRPDPYEGFSDAAGEFIDGYHGVSD
jgi:hypothetical protein